MEPHPREIAYEWVLTVIGVDEPVVLTDRQYQFYKENWQENKVFLSDMEISPSSVSFAFRRPALLLKKKYPCRTCGTTGFDTKNSGEWCKTCKGSGVDFTSTPRNL